MALFNWGSFALHSGAQSLFKIDCDALTGEDYLTIAYLLLPWLPSFGYVEAVPRGGITLANYLGLAVNPSSKRLLICDDVLTTGASMEKQRRGRDAIGAVIFARGACPDWVTPLFTMTS